MFVQLVLSVLLINVIDVVTHDPQLRQSGIVFTLFDCFLECVAHNGDQHVQESDLRDKRGEYKDQIADSEKPMVCEAIQDKLTKHQHVLIER